MLSLLWLRRDLRLKDNLPLFLSMQESTQVQPIFIFDVNILSRFKNKQDRRINFIIDSLHLINQELKQKNSEVLVFYGDPKLLIPKIANTLKVKKVFAGKDHEPYGIERDKAIAKEVNLQLENDHLLIEPTRILKDDGSAYKVFTPYFKKWLAQITPMDYAEYNKCENHYADSANLKFLLAQNNIYPINLNEGVKGYIYKEEAYWKANNAEKTLESFISSKLFGYAEARNFLKDTTSAISPYLRFGQLSIRECYRALMKQASTEHKHKWLSQLAWRDFYAMILYYYPKTISLEMQPQYRGIKWSNDPALLEKFTTGKTGYPIIDASIRQLITTGWMHNRARLIVASFMTKNLWLDWRLGEEFFAQYLMDYELSSNVGSWQWSASVGTDAQPYFRIFNPYLQSKKFDPEGEFIRTYIPELKLLSKKEIHQPKYGLYYTPIVDFESSRKNAIIRFRQHLHIEK